MEGWHACLLSALLLCVGAAQNCQQGISVVAPDVAVPGHATVVLVTLLGTKRLYPANITVRLLSDTVEERTQVLSETTTHLTGHGLLELDVPAGVSSGEYVLQTLANCSEPGNCALQHTSALRLVGVVRDVLVRASRKTYRPGSTVWFWVLALDYDLNLVSDVIGNVYLEDPRGVNVALWQEVPLYEGLKSFKFPVSEVAALGRWRVKVEVQGEVYAGQFDVSALGAGGAGGGSSSPEVAMAEEHYVELRFGRQMRRIYKPGLPFFGKVEAASTERSVRVRVKVYDNTTAIYSQDIEISSGEGTFIVPAILADSDVITLQAELVSVEGKEIDSHYVLAREPVHKWNSSSDCYLLVEGLEHTLQPGEETRASVLSTCPCERELHYVVMTDGLVTLWGQQAPGTFTDSDRPPGQGVDGTAICRLSFSFEVKAVMAPASRLLVYYLTDDGEPISDVVTFSVVLQQDQLSLSVEERKYWTPSQPIRASVTVETGSVVCLVAGRMANPAADRWTKAQPHTRVRTPVLSREQDFLEAGMSYFEHRCGQQFGGQGQPMSSSDGSGRRRGSIVSLAGIEQLWLWKCFNYSLEVQTLLPAPDDAGRWTLWVLSLSRGAGLRFSPPASVTVLRPLQVDFQLPFSLKVGEAVEVDVRIGNNVDSCVDVTALLSLTEGAHFLSNTMLYVTEKLRLGPHGATSLVVRLVVTSSGYKNMTAEVTGYGSGNCQDSSGTFSNSSLVGSVTSTQSVLVHPEGQVQTDTESAYFCANENVVVSTSSDASYQFISAPRSRTSLVFEVRADGGATGEVHVALSDVARADQAMYKVVIADPVSWLSRGVHGFGVRLTSARTQGILSGESFNTFWLAWEPGELYFGTGSEPHNNTVLYWRADRKMTVRHIGFASVWGRPAEFRVWSYNEEAGFSQVLHLDVPRSLVPGTEQGTLLVSGGLSLPLAARRDSATYRCLGMTECTSFASTVASFTPLLAPGDLPQTHNNSLTEHQVIDSLMLQLQLLLTFMKTDFSFGDHKGQGSLRNTVEALVLLKELQSRLSVDPGLVGGVKSWLLTRQAADGSFRPLPADLVPSGDPHHSTFEETIQLTSETLSTLIHVGLDTQKDSEVAVMARSYLERSLARVTSPCALAALAYALALSHSDALPGVLRRLQDVSTNEEGDFGWQVLPPTSPPHVGRQRGKSADRDSGTVEEYKASLYALMTFSYLGDLKLAEPVARYLFYRSHLLDKHTELVQLAVKAFMQFGRLAADKHRSLTVSLATSGMELTDTAELRADTPAQTLQLPSLPTKVFVYATGAGCATVQGQVRYSTYALTRRSSLLELWAGVEDEVVIGHNLLEQVEGRLPLLKLKTCFRWKGSTPSGVLRLEVTLFSGFRLDSVSPTVLDSSGKMTTVHHGALHDKIWFVIANVSSACAVCLRYSVQSDFAVSSLRPAFARVHPAGRADLGAETFFHTRRSSPLLADVTDDDVITWFGSIDAGEPQLSSNFSDVCECGRMCPPAGTKKSQKPTPLHHKDPSEGCAKANSTSNIHPHGDTLFKVTRGLGKNSQNSSRIVDTLGDGGNSSNSRDLDRVQGNISEEFKESLKLNKTSKVLRKDGPAKSQNEVRKLGEIRGIVNVTGENRKTKNDLEGNRRAGDGMRDSPSMHSVNKERREADTRPGTTTSEKREARNIDTPKVGKGEKLFVLDRDTLWGMLKEAVHVELDKSQKKDNRLKSTD